MKFLKTKLVTLLSWLVKDKLLTNSLSNIKFVESYDKNSMAFNFVIGVDVSKTQDGKIGIHMNNMVFASGNETGREFINSSTPGLLRDTVSVLLSSVGRYVFQSPESIYHHMSIPTSVGDIEMVSNIQPKKIDPKDLN